MKMKIKLLKEKWFFQSLRETKSVKETDDGAVEISWYASTKDKDRWGDVVEPKAFQSALERYMTNPIVLLQHKAEKPIWIVENAQIDENWLFIKAKISQNTDWVIDLIKNWVLRAFSIWYSIKDYETDVKELADGSYDMTNIIKDLELYEISVVSIPMNPYALSKSVEDLFEVEQKEDEDFDKTENQENNEETQETVQDETAQETVEEVEEEQKNNDVQEENEKEEEKNGEMNNNQVEEENTTEISQETTETVETEQKSEEVETEEVEKVENVVDEQETDVESETKEADENSEIKDDAEIEEVSENDSESESNDENIVETHNEEIVETKSIETKSTQTFDFKSEIVQLSKSFEERLAEKDTKIKELESKVERMTKLFSDTLETVDRMVTVVKNTPVASWLQYKAPLKKWWFFDIAEIIKSL